jgi:hypothetical protein
MLRKLSIAAAIASALLMSTSAFADSAQNNVHGDKNATVNKNVHGNKNATVNKGVQSNKNATVNKNVHRNKTVNVNKAAHGKYVVGKTYNGHYWYGENRHRWHGRWYAYGDGPCWIKVDGLWFWNASTCAI